jgi:phosphosulfolactate synthase (CoM biosynthesis protein A)
VVIGAEGIIDGISRRRSAAVARLLNALGRERLMFEAPDSRTFTWYVRTWGHDLNLLVDHDQILTLERARAWAPAGPRATGTVEQRRS